MSQNEVLSRTAGALSNDASKGEERSRFFLASMRIMYEGVVIEQEMGVV